MACYLAMNECMSVKSVRISVCQCQCVFMLSGKFGENSPIFFSVLSVCLLCMCVSVCRRGGQIEK